MLQALLWAWTHALPIRLQRPEGDAARLPSMAPGALPLAPKPAMEQPLVVCAAAKEVIDRPVSSSEAGAGSPDAALIGRAQQVTWAVDDSCLRESAAECQQVHAAVSSSAMRSAVLMLVAVLVWLSLLLIMLRHV